LHWHPHLVSIPSHPFQSGSCDWFSACPLTFDGLFLTPSGIRFPELPARSAGPAPTPSAAF
jgi:hypothetical protein